IGNSQRAVALCYRDTDRRLIGAGVEMGGIESHHPGAVLADHYRVGDIVDRKRDSRTDRAGAAAPDAVQVTLGIDHMPRTERAIQDRNRQIIVGIATTATTAVTITTATAGSISTAASIATEHGRRGCGTCQS